MKKITETQLKAIIAESIQKILNEGWRRSPVIGVDFDGTVVTHEYPYIGEDVGAVPVLQKLVDNGCKIVLNTMRSHRPVSDNEGNVMTQDPLQEAIDWFASNNIPLYGINENPNQKSWTDSPKIHANLYIDDAMAGCPLVYGHVDWRKIEKILEKRGYIEIEEGRGVDDNSLLSDVLDFIVEWTDEAEFSENPLTKEICEKLYEIMNLIYN